MAKSFPSLALITEHLLRISFVISLKFLRKLSAYVVMAKRKKTRVGPGAKRPLNKDNGNTDDVPVWTSSSNDNDNDNLSKDLDFSPSGKEPLVNSLKDSVSCESFPPGRFQSAEIKAASSVHASGGREGHQPKARAKRIFTGWSMGNCCSCQCSLCQCSLSMFFSSMFFMSILF